MWVIFRVGWAYLGICINDFLFVICCLTFGGFHSIDVVYEILPSETYRGENERGH